MRPNDLPIYEAKPNYSARTFTIRKSWRNGDKSKYRTYRMSREEFDSCLHNTSNDWSSFCHNSQDYYVVR